MDGTVEFMACDLDEVGAESAAAEQHKVEEDIMPATEAQEVLCNVLLVLFKGFRSCMYFEEQAGNLAGNNKTSSFETPFGHKPAV